MIAHTTVGSADKPSANVSTDESVDSKKDNKKNNSDQCQELKNIAYKSMLLNNNNIISDNKKRTDAKGIEEALTNELKLNSKEPWSKMDKTIKIKKLEDYVDKLTLEKNLSTTEKDILLKYLVDCLDRNRLVRVKDVIYDKEKEYIKNIPFLHFNHSTRHFTLKRSQKNTAQNSGLSDKTRKKKDKDKKQN